MVLFRDENLYCQIRNVPVIELLKMCPLRFYLGMTFPGKHSFWAPRKGQSYLPLEPECKDPIEILTGVLQACFSPRNLKVLQTGGPTPPSSLFFLNTDPDFGIYSQFVTWSKLKQMFIELNEINAYWVELLFDCFT